MASSKGIPCGGSFISASKKCRLNEYGLQGAEKFLSANALKQIREDLDAFEEALGDYNPAAQKYFREMVKGVFADGVSSQGRVGKTRKQPLKEEHFVRVAKGARILAQDGPPKGIHDKGGTPMEMSKYIRPALSRKGNMSWEDPIAGMTYSKSKQGDNNLELNRVLPPFDMVQGRLRAAQDFYQRWTRLTPEKEFGSVEAAKKRDVSESEVTEFLSSMTPSQRKDMRTSGIDLGGESRAKRDPNNPNSGGNRARFTSVLTSESYLQQRERDIAKAYLRQTPGPGKFGISPWTGLPVSPPGIMVKGGYPSTLDHAKPLSDLYERLPKNRKASDGEILSLLRERDVADNFVVGERGINSMKGDRTDWADITKSMEKRQKQYETDVLYADRNPQFAKGGGTVSVTPAKVIRQTQSIPETPYRKETSRMTPEKRAEAQAFLRELQGK